MSSWCRMWRIRQEVAGEVRALGRKGVSKVVDVTNIPAMEALARDVDAEFGKTDILVTSAGVMGARKLLVETSAEEWLKTMEVNLNATFYCVKAFLPGMLARDSGRIITLSSASGKLPAAYLASDGAKGVTGQAMNVCGGLVLH